MTTKAVSSADQDRPTQSREAEARDLESMAVDLQDHIDDAARALQALQAQQANCSSLIRQLQTHLDDALKIGREMKNEVQHRAEEPRGVVATLQAAVGKTKDRVIDRVEHVREHAVATFHRIKGDDRTDTDGHQGANPQGKDTSRSNGG
jgi:chromosome segregation ATPase